MWSACADVTEASPSLSWPGRRGRGDGAHAANFNAPDAVKWAARHSSRGTVGKDLLIATVLVLFGWAAAMALVALALRWSQQIRARSKARREEHWQPLVEEFVLEGWPLPPIRHRDLDTVLDIVLRFAATLRGPEADRIIAFMEQDGYVDLRAARPQIAQPVEARPCCREAWAHALAARSAFSHQRHAG